MSVRRFITFGPSAPQKCLQMQNWSNINLKNARQAEEFKPHCKFGRVNAPL